MGRLMPQLFISLLLASPISCGQTQQNSRDKAGNGHLYTNELIHESSPYLLQHAHNPVNWYPWGEKALQKAKDENKMLIISIGYAACHWCHVMEKETYEDTTVARIMNEHFISIKVDREERPDVDQVYMNAAQLISGSGGWPLNALAMADGKPFFAGTYFPKKNWLEMLQYFIDLNKKNPSALKEQAEKVTMGIHSIENAPAVAPINRFNITDLDNLFKKVKPNIDYQYGGSGKAPKFPMPSQWEYLLYYYYLSHNKDALNAVTTTLNNMAAGGIYDHVGGGFARYSTDATWHVPHFEKMLYDNAQLVSLYAHAYQLTKDPVYKTIVFETLDFIQREMTSPEGGFYSSLDADSEGEEGKFYVWKKHEIDSLLGKDANLFAHYYHLTKNGNWEKGNNILFRDLEEDQFASKNNITKETLHQLLDRSKAKLLAARNKRVRPGLDDKILTSWNALMTKAYIDAYRAFGEESFKLAATRNALFLSEKAIGKNNSLTRNYKDGKASISAFLDDYAFMISAFINLYQASFEEHWLYKANELAAYVETHFYDPASRMYYYTSDEQAKLIARKMDISDNVIPGSNSEMAKNLFFLGHFLGNDQQINMAKQMLANVSKDVAENIPYYANWGLLKAALAGGLYEVAIAGKEVQNIRRQLDQHYLPNMIVLGTEDTSTLELLADKFVPGETTIYVCENKVCRRPVTDVNLAIAQIQPKK